MCTEDSWLFSDGDWRTGHPTGIGQGNIAQAILTKCYTVVNECVGL
jgi:hypothetical protein